MLPYVHVEDLTAEREFLVASQFEAGPIAERVGWEVPN
jgi:hypothetical protein